MVLVDLGVGEVIAIVKAMVVVVVAVVDVEVLDSVVDKERVWVMRSPQLLEIFFI